MDERNIFYKNVLKLVIPMALQNLINVGISSLDVIMLSEIGDKSVSGASLGSQVQFIMSLILFGITSGASVLVAQYWGKKDVKAIEKILGIALKFAIVVGILFTIVTMMMPDLIMSFLSNDEMVIEEGAKYLRLVSIGYMFICINMVYLNTLRSVEIVMISTIVYLIGLVANGILNYALIFGKFGAPELGIEGAAIATAIALGIETLIVIYYDRRRNRVFKFRISMLFEKDKILSKDFRKYSAPVIVNELMWGAGGVAIAAILGHLGSSVSAANAVAQVVRQLATVITFGIASAAAIMIGKVIGEGSYDKARLYGRRFVKLSIIMGIIGAAVVLIVRPIAMANMSMSAQTEKYFSLMMFVMAYFVIGQAYNTTMIVGIFRAGGDIKFGLFLDVTCMWGVAILLGFIVAFVFNLPVIVVYAILLCDETIKVPLSTIRYISYKWLNNVTK